MSDLMVMLSLYWSAKVMDKDGSILKFSEGLEMVSARQNIGNNILFETVESPAAQL